MRAPRQAKIVRSPTDLGLDDRRELADELSRLDRDRLCDLRLGRAQGVEIPAANAA
jgi:hypothetical protein